MLADALVKLYARVPLGMRLGLEAMRAACKEEGDPQDAYRTVHVTGTNGKGSTCAMIESIARAAGERTGLYSSPHLCKFAERIRLDGEPIDDGSLEHHLERALRHDLSFFETATLAAFLAFRDRGITLGVIEVGIGGRLDATNVIARPTVTAITNVGLDHQDRLGPTTSEIAIEKAGIAKPGVPMFLGERAEIARARCVELGAQMVRLDAPDDLPHPPGRYQATNAAIAYAVTGELGIDDATRRRGLDSAHWPGRFERIDDYLLDGAHNPEGIAALLGSMTGSPPSAIIFGALADKKGAEMLSLLSGRFPSARFFYVAPQGRDATDLQALARQKEGTPCASLDDALTLSRALAGPNLICGSLYLVGEARAKLLGLPVDPPVAL